MYMKRYVKAGVDWGYYDKPEFDEIDKLYLPPMGEGETMASQIVTAVNKLIYKWYNDGDVFDTNSFQSFSGNDLSDYANWLYKNVKEAKRILSSIYGCESEDDYEELLQDLADRLLNLDLLKGYAERPKTGSIYDCDGRFECSEDLDDEDWY